MPDLGALLWPRTVALIGASADAESLRGRIFNVMRGHAFAGQLYPVSRSSAEVLGLKAYASVADLPQPADLAVIIIPAKHVPEELERCGKAGVRSAVVLSSGFAEAIGDEGGEDAGRDPRHRQALRHGGDGPQLGGLRQHRRQPLPHLQPGHGGRRPAAACRQGARARSWRCAAQSGGIGFAFFDHGRAKELSFRYVVTTGNEACLEALDFADFILDEGKTDALLLLLEDIKSAETFRRVAEKALKAGKPIIVNKIGQSDAGVRAAASHTAALAGAYAAYQAMFQRYGLIEGRDIGEMVDIAAGFLAWGQRLPQGRRVGICTGSGGGGGWMADACTAAGLEVPELDAETRRRIDEHLPAYGTSQNPVDATAQAVSKIGYAGLAELVLPSPMVDGIIVVMTARSPHSLERQREALARLAETTQKPILLWSYTLPAQKSVQILSEAGLPLYTDIGNCARTMRVMADYRALRERFLRPIEVTSAAAPDKASARAALAAAGPALCEWEARPILAGYGIGTNPVGTLAGTAEEAVAAARAIGGPVALKVQSPDILHKTEAKAVALNLALARGRARRLRHRARQRPAPCARGAHPRRAGAADGPARPRDHPGRQARSDLRPAADGGPRRRRGRGAEGCRPGARAAGRRARRARCWPG